MLTFPSTVRVYLAAEPVDLRKGFDGLSAATRTILKRDPLSGYFFVFYNRRRNRLKVLLWQPSGFLIIYKRLERGCFQVPSATRFGQTHVEMEATELLLMIEGIDLRGAKKRKRWSPLKALAGQAAV
ncbi:MAG: IS66 family insertion sequence element accessory protein TnpB [Deltaproteobacteria bacterium]|nr:IS66 family insertion sequence element accessory protein TnpB [Deltaproteobacteria bacterium]